MYIIPIIFQLQGSGAESITLFYNTIVSVVDAS